jgi:hypothetical protein
MGLTVPVWMAVRVAPVEEELTADIARRKLVALVRDVMGYWVVKQ